MSLYQLDWSSFDVETQKLIHLMLVSSTPERTIKVGRTIDIKMESFTTVRNYGLHIKIYLYFLYSTVHQTLLLLLCGVVEY